MLRIFIPAYNEGKVIADTISSIYRILDNRFKPFKLYLIDDGSIDNTSDVIKSIKLKDFVYVKCKGPSRRENLVQSMAKFSSNEDIVGFLDADRSTNEIALSSAVGAIENGYDIVIGSRYVHGAKIKRKIDRLFISKIFNTFVRVYFKSKIKDHECGFKFFRGLVLKKLVGIMGVNNNRKMFWDSEMLIRAQRMNLKILEIPVSWIEGPKSALSFKKELPMIKYIIKLKSRL